MLVFNKPCSKLASLLILRHSFRFFVPVKSYENRGRVYLVSLDANSILQIIGLVKISDVPIFSTFDFSLSFSSHDVNSCSP